MTGRYVRSRLLQVLPAVTGILLIGFLLIHLAPGDPVVALAGESGDAEYYAAMRARFGLDRSLPLQLGTYAANVLRGDLGTSYVHGRPVLDLILERLPATLLLTGSALVVSTVVGILLGAVAASRPRGVRDLTITTTTLGIDAVPVFWLGQLVLLGLSLHLGWFPVGGLTDARAGGGTLDRLHHLALPVLVLASGEVAAIARLTRAALLSELALPHTTTARAKGLSPRQVLRRHALRRALLPVVTLVGSRPGHLLGGAVVVEVIFSWPGIGRLLLAAMQNRDGPILLGVFLLTAVTVVVANLIVDLVYGWIDPRIRLR